MFDSLEIAKTKKYRMHMNKYNVIYLDISAIISLMARKEIPLKDITRFTALEIRNEIVESYPTLARFDDVSECILGCVNETKKKFVFIIDEWDAVIREAKNDTTTQ